MGRKTDKSSESDEPKSRRFIAPTPVRLGHFHHSVLDYFADKLDMSTSDVIRMAIDQLLRSQPADIIAEHRQYAEQHYVTDLQDDPKMLQRLRYALDAVQEPIDKPLMKVDSSEMQFLASGTRFDTEATLGPSKSARLPVRINSAKAFEDE